MSVTTTNEDGTLVVRMDLPGGNSINTSSMEILNATLDELDASDARAVVLTGTGRMFGAGLDLIESFDFDRAAMGDFMDAFDGLFVRFFSIRAPLVTAVNGHAIAGGAIAAFAGDYRILADGPFKMGITEVQVGIPFPAGAREISRYALPPHSWADAFLAGRLCSPAEARDLGMVHEVVPADTLMERALEKAAQLGSGGRAAARRIKADLKAPTLKRIAATGLASREHFLDEWFSEQGTAGRAKIRDSLLAKR